MKLLLKHGANANTYVDSCGNCLSIAQQGGQRDAKAIELLKQHGALPGEWELDSRERVSAALDDESFLPNRDMWSSILGAILDLDDVELIRKYVARFGADSIRNLNPSKGWRVPKSEAMLSELQSRGMNINARDWYGRTFLHYAACNEAPAVAKSLLAFGIDIDAIDLQSRTTALGLAAEHGALAMVDFLLDQGANPQLPIDAKWAQPLWIAQAQGHDSVVDRLKQSDCRP